MIINEDEWSGIEQILFRYYPKNEATIMLHQLEEGYKNGNIDLSFHDLMQALEIRTPIQYILGEAYFDEFSLKVRPGVLIPRPETDELVHWIKKSHNRQEKYSILDIGTGSGCIAIAIAKAFPNANINAIDISNNALDIARQNALNMGVKINFAQEDILTAVPSEQTYDIIVSNPPYIHPDEAIDLDIHVLEHEPKQALFVTNNDPLQFYKAIEKFAVHSLNKNGFLYLELHSLYAQDTQTYFNNNGWITCLRDDMQGMPRMLQCKKSH